MIIFIGCFTSFIITLIGFMLTSFYEARARIQAGFMRGMKWSMIASGVAFFGMMLTS